MWQKTSLKLKRKLSEHETKLRVISAFKEKSRVHDEFSHFLTETSFTPLVLIYNSKSWVKRLAWIMVVLVFFAWSFIQCYWLLQKYFAYPMEVKLDLKASIELDFPSVTICNLNPIRHRSLKDEPFRILEDIAEPNTDDVLFKATLNHWTFEENCQSKNQYRCTNGLCLDPLLVCDGSVDCMDGCDEKNCEHNVCKENYFRCKSGRCIPQYWLCDADDDCPDKEDELLSCPTNSTNITDTTSPTNNQSAGTDTATNTSTHTITTTGRVAQSSSTAAKRLKRDTLTHQHTYTESDSAAIARKLKKELKKLHYKIEERRGKVNREKIIEDLYGSYMKYVNTVRKKGGTIKGDGDIPDHRRNKRAAKKPSVNTTVDWSTVLSNSNFTKWTMLDTNASMQSSFYEMKDDEYVAAVTYAYITAQLDPKIVESSGNVKEDFIASCRFGGYQCSPKNFTYFHNHKYGNCYTFNSGLQESSPTTKFPGPAYGLILELFINQGEYVANLAPEAGARVVIHKKGSIPFPEDEGIDVMPGRATSIGIKQHSFSRLPPPHGECGDTPKTTDYYVKHLGTSLSKLSCLKSCYQDIIIEYCNCAVPFFFLVENVTVCNLSDPLDEVCVDMLPVMAQGRYKLCDQLCPQPCQETRYETSISQAVWPSDKYDNYLDKKLQQTNSLYLHINSTSQEFTKIQIYFQDLIYQHVEQQIGYESMSLISDLGGQLGLWLGLSAITIGEFFSFLCSIGRSLPSACSGVKANTVQSLPNLQPATLEELYDDIYPDVSNYEPPEITLPSKFQPDL